MTVRRKPKTEKAAQKRSSLGAFALAVARTKYVTTELPTIKNTGQDFPLAAFAIAVARTHYVTADVPNFRKKPTRANVPPI